MNAIGAVLTLGVFWILLLTKFKEGAWIVGMLIPILVYSFYSVKKHYGNVSKTLSTRMMERTELSIVADVVVVPIADIHRGSLRAIQYAQRLSNDVRVITIATDPETKQEFLRRWNCYPEVTQGIKLVLVEYDYRDVLTPIVQYIEHVNNHEFPCELTTVVIPEFIPEHYAARFLHNQTASRLRGMLRGYRDIVIIEVPFHIDSQ